MELSFESDKSDNEINTFEDDTRNDLRRTCENESDEVEINTDVTKKKTRNRFDWKIHSERENLDEALDFLENEGFVCYDFSDLKCGQKFYFRCKMIPKERKT